MHDTTASSPFMYLLDIERQARAHAAPLPQTAQHKSQWDGIGFSFGGRSYVTPITEVSEILTCPELTIIPGARPWARGVANVRGNLVTVVDLAGFFGKPGAAGKGSRVLIINRPELMAGVLIDQLLGLRHFAPETRRDGVAVAESALAPYIDGEFQDGGATWTVFSLAKLAQSTKFLNIAA